MSEIDTTQEVTAPVQTGRPRVYAPWMIWVLLVFFVCEGLFFVWGHEAIAWAVLGLFVAGFFGPLRFFWVRKEWSCCGTFIVSVILILVLCALFLMPAGSCAREAARRNACMNNLKQLGLALHNYHDAQKMLPPAFVADEKGRRMHSWRTLILPYIEEGQLYKKYDFQKPWDSPENRKLVDETQIDSLRCPSSWPDEEGHWSDYVAVVGEDTLWSTDGTSRSLKDIKVHPSNVAMLTEINKTDILWSEPRDVILNDFLSGKLPWSDGMHPVVACNYRSSAFYRPHRCRNVLFADGSVRLVHVDLTPEEIRKLFSISEPIDVESIDATMTSPPAIVYRHVVFYIWLATLVMQLLYTFFPAKGRKEHGCTG